jgi:hypothetical protein
LYVVDCWRSCKLQAGSADLLAANSASPLLQLSKLTWHDTPLLLLADVAQVKKVYLLARGKKQLTAAQRVDKVRTTEQQQQQQAGCLATGRKYIGLDVLHSNFCYW